jgi:WD40 repeat protein
MKRAALICVFLLIILSACVPAERQPVFSPSSEATVTPMPIPASTPNTSVSLPGVIWAFEISPDSSTIAFATSRGLVLFDLKTSSQIHILDEGENLNSLAWSPDGKKLAIGEIKGFEESGQAVLKILDTSSWKVILQPKFEDDLKNERILDLAWNPDGNEALAISTDMHGVMVLYAATGKIISKQTGYAGSVKEISWSPDGSRLVTTGDMAYSLRRWNVSNDKAVRLFDQRLSNPWHVLWMPDGKRIVSGHVYGMVCFWTVATNKCDGLIQAHRTAVFSMAVNSDGSRLATGGGVIRIWDTTNGKLLSGFGEDKKIIYNQLAWVSPDQLIAALQNGLDDPEMTIVRLWNPTTGAPLVEFRGGKR